MESQAVEIEDFEKYRNFKTISTGTIQSKTSTDKLKVTQRLQAFHYNSRIC